MPAILTVILNWRTPDMTLQSCEAALREMQGMQGAITIVDNDSGDGSFEKMSAEVTRRGWDTPAPGGIPVQVLQSGHNGGFGAGNNFGIRAGLPGGGRRRPGASRVEAQDRSAGKPQLPRFETDAIARLNLGWVGGQVNRQRAAVGFRGEKKNLLGGGENEDAARGDPAGAQIGG